MAKRAICIGINRYPGTYSDLRGCVNDAREWAQELRWRGFNAVLLLDEDAQKAALTAAIREIVSSAVPDDLVVVTYSGHGTWTMTSDIDPDEIATYREAIAPFDVMQTGPLHEEQLQDLLTGKPGVRVVFIADTCHGGTFARKLAPPNHLEAPRVRFLPPEHFMEKQRPTWVPPPADRPRGNWFAIPRSRHSALVLSACQDWEHSFDTEFLGKPHGALTWCALKALKSIAPTASYEDWYRAIQLFLPSASCPQRPMLEGTPEQRRWTVFE